MPCTELSLAYIVGWQFHCVLCNEIELFQFLFAVCQKVYHDVCQKLILC